MSIVDARNLRRAYGPQTILDDVSVTLQPGERVGVVGVNGSGKSTLGSILAGAESPDTGEISYRRGARLAYLLQVPHFDPERSVLDEALAGLEAWNQAHARYQEATQALTEQRGSMEAWLQKQAAAINDIERLGGWDATHRAEAVLSNLGLHRHDAKLGTLSGGEKRRVALARALVSQPDLLVLDEPTNHLDLESIEWLEQHLSEELQGALFLITHDRYLLNRVAQRTLEIEGGKLYSYDGGFEAYLEGKAERLAHQARVESNRQNFLRQELEWLRRQPKARTTKSKARVDRAQEALQQKGPAPARRLSLQMQTARSGKTILELHELRLEVPGRTLVDDLTLYLTQGERMGILGPNGSGKTTLLRAVLDELQPDAGHIVVGQNARIGYLSQARSGLNDEASVLDNVGAGSGYVQLGQQRIDARSYLERFLFRPDKQRQPVGSLSGGERTRVALAKLLSEPANLLLLDEPTNDLDIDTLAALEEMLLEQNGTALVVTHDRWFLDRIATGILVAEGDGHWTPYQGDYTTVRALRKQEREQASQGRPTSKKARSSGSSPPARDKPKPRGTLTYGERLELERIMDDIEAAETRVAALEKELADPEIYQNRSEEVPTLIEDLDKAKAEADRLMQRWEELEAKKSADEAS